MVLKSPIDYEDTAIPSIEDTDLYKVLQGGTGNKLENGFILSLYILSIASFIWHMYFAYSLPVSRLKQGVIHLFFLLGIFFISNIDLGTSTKKGKLDLLFNSIMALLWMALIGYVLINYSRWLTSGRILLYTQSDLIVGGAIMLLVVSAVYLAYGKIIPIVIIGTLLYGLFGNHIPRAILNGVFTHSGFTLERIISGNTIALGGVFGTLNQVGATWVIVFILFAGIMEAYGGMDYIIEQSKGLGNWISSGTMQVAVISSMILGSISGGSAQNVATTGSFTIPLMESEGVLSRFAGAIESIASTGGQILPPVMGSATFLMADLLNISYVRVITAAIIPALLFYVSIVVTVHLLQGKYGWLSIRTTTGKDSTTNLSIIRIIVGLIEPLPYLIGLITLILTLMVIQFGPMVAGFYAIVFTMIGGLIRAIIIQNSLLKALKDWLLRTVEGVKIGMKNMAPISAALASLGIVVQILTSTAFTQRFTFQISILAGGVFLLLALFTATASVFFGMGMPTPAAYIVVVILTAPLLIQHGTAPIVAHFFVLYFAVLSTISPPVGLSCAVASGICKDTTFWNICKSTVRLGLFAFVAPFALLFNPEIILWDSFSQSLITSLLLIPGFLSLCIATVGYNGARPIGIFHRLGYLATGLVVIFAPSQAIQILVGAPLAGLIIIRLLQFDLLSKSAAA